VLSSLGAHVYDIHHDAERFGITRLPAISLQLLHVAAHLDAIDADIRPRVNAGHVVLLDRYWWSTWVYGTIGGIEPKALELMIDLERRHWGDLLPDPAILIRRETPLRSDTSPELFKSLIAKYDELALREQQHHRVVTIDNDSALERATSEITRLVKK
jgi:dTMP kinase